jgi:transposase
MLNIDRKTVRKYSKLDSKPKYILSKRKKSKLDDFKDTIDLLLEKAPYTAERIFEIISENNFTGKLGIVKKYVSSKKKSFINKATLRFETIPGQQAQVDWGSFGNFTDLDGKKRKLYCFCIILGFSRMRYIEFTTDMKTETLIKCHINAFEYFDGYTNEILYDNMKQVVIKRLLLQKDSKLNPMFEDFAGFYGFKPLLCRIYRPQTKGKIENTVKYVKSNFFPGIEFNSLENLNIKAKKWCEKVNNKIHGTTKELPYDRLKQENLNKLSKIYVIPIKITRKVERESTVNFKNNKYSVPIEYVGKIVEIENFNNIIKFKYKNHYIAEHELIFDKFKTSYNKDHYNEILEKSKFSNIENTLFNNKIICSLSNDIEDIDLKKYDEI